MQTVKIAELIELLHIRKGAQAVTLITQTAPPMNKGGTKGNPVNPFYGLVTKRSWVNGMINWNYANAVSRQREREGHPEPDFEAQPRKWGRRIPHSPLVEHLVGNEVKYYLELKVEKVVEDPLFYYKGELLDETNDKDNLIIAQIKEWINPPRQAATQETNKEIILRDYSLKNILSIKINNVEYRIDPS